MAKTTFGQVECIHGYDVKTTQNHQKKKLSRQLAKEVQWNRIREPANPRMEQVFAPTDTTLNVRSAVTTATAWIYKENAEGKKLRHKIENLLKLQLYRKT